MTSDISFSAYTSVKITFANTLEKVFSNVKLKQQITFQWNFFFTQVLFSSSLQIWGTFDLTAVVWLL